jgi:hypothetical protein
MDTTLWILIYSKFSPACNELFSFIEQFKIPTPFKLLEIDNKDIRKRVLSDKRFSIKSVPCIISLNSAGVASQYEGVKAFEVVNAMKPEVERYIPSSPSSVKLQDTPRSVAPSQISISEEPRSQPSPPQSQQPSTDNSVTMIEDLIDEEPPASSPPPKVDQDISMLNKGDRSVSSSIKGEKISAASVLAQMQKTEINPRMQRPEPLEREEAPKQTGAKVNVSSVMSSARV